MRHALFLVLALGLAACSPGTETTGEALGGADAGLSPVAADAGGIEVTPLDAPAAAAAAPAAAVPAAAAPAALPEGGVTALADAALAEVTGAEADSVPQVPVSVATPATPHPRPRPAGPGTAAAEEPAAPPPKSQPQIRCEAAGGVWGQLENQGGFLCQKLTRDGGQSCSKKSDCFGECLAPSRTCSPVAPLMGCNEVLDENGRRVTLCLQ